MRKPIIIKNSDYNRPVWNGRSVGEIFESKDFEALDKAMEKLKLILKNEQQQREKLDKVLSGRVLPKLSEFNYGTPMIDEGD